MPRTYRYLKYSRSEHYKRDKERGFQKIDDRAMHHKNRNDNYNTNEITYNKFDASYKTGQLMGSYFK